MKPILAALCGLLALFCGSVSPRSESKPAKGEAEHVVLIVWDGMRPDFVTEANTPTLWKVAQEGVTFRNHHSVYPTLTSVNATALATGVFPGRSGRIANYEYQPAINPTKMVRMDSPETVRKGDDVTGQKYLALPTIAEIVQASGGRTAIAGTKPAPLLFDRKPRSAEKNSITLVEGTTLPESARTEIEKLAGTYPPETVPCAAQDKWTTRALTEALWKDGVPEFSVLWMGDPDRSEHATAPGSETARTAIKSVDANLARVLQALEAKHARDKTDILVVSDHGFSTIGRGIDVGDLLSKAGLRVAALSETNPPKGAIRVVGNGGTLLFYVNEHDAGATARLVEWLQQSDFAGVIFSRTGRPGTFPLSQVQLETVAGPDVVLSFRWTDRRNDHGVAGMIDANGSGEAKGTHGTLSPFDIHNLLIAAGPDFRPGLSSDMPSGNLDIAPTILHILGLTPPEPLDGRILVEAMMNGGTAPKAKKETVEATRTHRGQTWRQYLRLSKVGASTYIDEGNGAVSAE